MQATRQIYWHSLSLSSTERATIGPVCSPNDTRKGTVTSSSLVKFISNIGRKSKTGPTWSQKRRGGERSYGTVGQTRTDILIEKGTAGARVRRKKRSCVLVLSREFSASDNRNIAGDAVGGQ